MHFCTVKVSTLIIILSTALLLLVLGMIFLLGSRAERLVDEVQQQTKLVVELQKTMESNDIVSVQNQIASLPEAAPHTIEHISRDQALKEMKAELTGLSYTSAENPFTDIIIVGVKPNYVSKNGLQDIANKIKSIHGVRNVIYEQDFVSSIGDLLRQFRIGLSIFALFFLSGVVTLLYFNLSVELLNHKRDITIMNMVGATTDFIRAPFIRRAAITAGYSVALALAVLFLIAYIIPQLMNISHLFAISDFILPMIIVVLVGFFVSITSTYIIVSLYLKNIS